MLRLAQYFISIVAMQTILLVHIELISLSVSKMGINQKWINIFNIDGMHWSALLSLSVVLLFE